MTDDGEPNNKTLRDLVEGWAKVADGDQLLLLRLLPGRGVRAQPDDHEVGRGHPVSSTRRATAGTGSRRRWPTSRRRMHALYLGLRLAWDPAADPKAMIDELHEKFYGSAGEGDGRVLALHRRRLGRRRRSTPAAGSATCGAGPRRSSDEARELLDRGRDGVRRRRPRSDRIALADESLGLFEQFMKMRRDLAERRLRRASPPTRSTYRDRDDATWARSTSRSSPSRRMGLAGKETA